MTRPGYEARLPRKRCHGITMSTRAIQKMKTPRIRHERPFMTFRVAWQMRGRNLWEAKEQVVGLIKEGNWGLTSPAPTDTRHRFYNQETKARENDIECEMFFKRFFPVISCLECIWLQETYWQQETRREKNLPGLLS